MAKLYNRTDDGFYRLHSDHRPWLWIAWLVVLAIVVTIARYFLPLLWLPLLAVATWSLVAILVIGQACSVVKRLIKAGTLTNFLEEIKLTNRVTSALIDTMTVNRMQTTPQIRVPDVSAVVRLPHTATVRVEKLAGMYDIDRLTEDVTSSLKGRLSSFVVTSSRLTADGLWYEFGAEDVATDRTWRPATPAELVQPSHVLKLQEGLTINLADQPHIIVWGKSGSGKTTVLLSIIAQLIGHKANIFFLDGKDEFSAFKNFYPSEKIATENEAILELLADVCATLTERQAIVSEAVRERKKLGLRGYDIGLAPVVLIVDETGSLISSFDAKAKKQFLAYLTQIAQKGRSVSVFLVVGTQSPKADVIPTEIRSQFATKILLGSASQENQRMAFDEAVTKGDVERFKGFYLVDGVNHQPQRFNVTDLHTHGLNRLEVFEELYKKQS